MQDKSCLSRAAHPTAWANVKIMGQQRASCTMHTSLLFFDTASKSQLSPRHLSARPRSVSVTTAATPTGERKEGGGGGVYLKSWLGQGLHFHKPLLSHQGLHNLAPSLGAGYPHSVVLLLQHHTSCLHDPPSSAAAHTASCLQGFS